VGGIRPCGRNCSPLGPREEQDDPLGTLGRHSGEKDQIQRLQDTPLWYADVGREAKKGIVVEAIGG
jgi:hypothetical protein